MRNTYNKAGMLMVLVMSAVLFITLLSFSPCVKSGFINLDDPSYVLLNSAVKNLSLSSVKRMFTSFVVGNYHPITILSFALEYNFFGENPAGYHLDNIILHMINVLLVYSLVWRLCGNKMCAVITCVLFAIHPMRVESVAWITERKDVLFGLFYISSLLSYLLYLDNGRKRNGFLILAFLFFALSLMSKPAAISLPLVMFLLDYYRGIKLSFAALIEKLPFLLLSCAYGAVALYGLSSPHEYYEDFVPMQLNFSLLERVALSSYALAQYVLRLFMPLKLSIFYPFPQRINHALDLKYYLCLPGLLLAAFLWMRYWRGKRYVTFGVLFFVFTIFFNLPLVISGYALMADRFTYVPYLGLFFTMAVAFTLLFEKIKKKPVYFTASLIVVLTAVFYTLSLLTFQRCKVWKNSGTLWSDVVKKYPGQTLAYDFLAKYLVTKKEFGAALKLLDKAVSLDPDYYLAYFDRGNIYLHYRDYDKALSDFTLAIDSNPQYIHAYNNRGSVYLLTGNPDAAIPDFSKSLEIFPYDTVALNNRGIAYLWKQEYEKALEDFKKVLSINPSDKQTALKVGVINRRLSEGN